MAVELSELVPSLEREVTPPGETIYANATEDHWVGFLTDGFWEAVLDGLLGGYTCDEDGLVTPVSGTTDLSRDFQQVVVMYAGVRVVRTALLNSQSSFRAKAGPVEYETALSAQVLQALLTELQERRTRLLRRLMDDGLLPYFAYIDGVAARDYSLSMWETYYVV